MELEKPSTTLSYRVVIPNHENDEEDELVRVSVLDDSMNTERNTFRKYAFFHASAVSADVDTRTIITECIREFIVQNRTIADTWEKGYERLRTAVTAEPLSENVHKLLRTM